MKITEGKKIFIRRALIIFLFFALLAASAACQDLYPSTTTPQTPAAPATVTGPTIITTRDAALLAVYQRLLSEAKSYEAKTYLADFYTTCDNWTAESEYFRDGSGTWLVTVDMTSQKDWKWRPYWQQASWLVYRDGKVIPSTLFQANALRIEADLQSLSPEPASASQ
jgi:hypothetical protein